MQSVELMNTLYAEDHSWFWSRKSDTCFQGLNKIKIKREYFHVVLHDQSEEESQQELEHIYGKGV